MSDHIFCLFLRLSLSNLRSLQVFFFLMLERVERLVERADCFSGGAEQRGLSNIHQSRWEGSALLWIRVIIAIYSLSCSCGRIPKSKHWKLWENMENVWNTWNMFCLCTAFVCGFICLLGWLLVWLFVCWNVSLFFFFSCIDIAAKVIPSTVVMSVVTKYSKNEKL